ncbi:MAG: Rha family transcriptional regulator [Clostridium sp.]|nr:Rha family transcriptional regulator [Clostridium sp.]
MSNTLVPQNNNTGVGVKTLPSYEAAKMMEREHAKVLKMLEGETYKDGRTKVVGIIPTLRKARTRVSDYFIESTYKVEGNNKSYKYYECTKMGCELLANKTTGEKGILFTARYVKKFNEMEQQIEQQMVSVEQITQIAVEAATKQVMVMMNPIIDRLDKIVQSVNAPRSEQLTFDTLDLPYTATNIGEKINRTASVTNKILLQKGILSVKDGSWTLNKQYEDKGWGKTVKGQYRGKTYVRYTKKGMQEIIKLFK